MFTGPLDKPETEGLRDLGVWEIAILVPLTVLVIVLGVDPRPVLDRIEPSVEVILDRIEARTDFVVPDHGRVDEVVQAPTEDEG